MSSLCTGAKQHVISDLPQEIFTIIFKYLSVNERKTVKLVCKSWLEYCNILSFSNDEVLNCMNVYQLSDTYELLRQSERQYLNLRFENVCFDGDAEFWRNRGLRIRSLDFIDCQFYNENLEEIIIGCENLCELSFTYTYDFQNIIKYEELLPPINFREVSAKGIVREKLSSLEIYIANSYWIQLSDYILHQLLLVFPSLRILKIYSDFEEDWWEGVRLDLSEIPERYYRRVTMSPVVNYLIASRERIKKLMLYFPQAQFSPSSLRCILETVSSLERLTELCIGTGNSATIEDIGPFLHLKTLRSLDFRIPMSSSDMASFLLQLLHLNSSLQNLEIFQPFTSFSFTKPFCDELISSGLKTFAVAFRDIHLEDPTSFESCISTQKKSSVLPSLSVWLSEDYSSENTLPFLQSYRSLYNFEVDYISHDVLRCLLKYQKKLRRLIIAKANMNDFLIYPDDLTFNELTDIEYLDLMDPFVIFYFLRTLSPDPILANLKYLRLSVDNGLYKEFPSNLLRSADAMPFLECLCVSNTYDECMPFDVIVKLCTKLSHLRYFRYDGHWSIEDNHLMDEHYRELFSICPSLRVLVHGLFTYFFDTMKDKVLLKEDDHRSRFSIPRTSRIPVSWLTF